MTSDSSRFIHQPVAEREIRLLDFSAGQSDPFVVTVSLDEPPPFSALSYCWGMENCLHPFKYGSQIVVVTSALLTILDDFRRRNYKGRLWADMICIDQSNNNEKEHQIPLIAEIYSKAEHVWAWLGDVSEEARLSEAAFLSATAAWRSFLDAETGSSNLTWEYQIRPPRFKVHDWISRHKKANPNTLLPSHDDLETGVVALLNSPWWLRLWTWQEAVASRSLAFVYGNTLLSDQQVFSTIAYCFNLGRLRPDYDHSFDRFATAYYARLNLYATIMNRRVHPSPQNSFGIYQAIWFFQDEFVRQSTIRVDRIFAILSLLDEELRQEILPIAVTDTPTQVYTRVAHVFARRSLRTLSLHGCHSTIDELPSWVPVFDKIEDYIPISVARSYRAGTGQLQTTDRVVAGNMAQLRLQGFILAHVSSCVPFDSSRGLSDHANDPIASWLDECEETVSLNADPYRLSVVNLYRTITLGIPFHEWQRADISFSSPSRQHIQGTPADEPSPSQAQTIPKGPTRYLTEHERETIYRYRWPLWSRLRQHAYLVTTKGLMGVGRNLMKPGDLVCIINLAPTPLVLRPKPEKGDVYEFVGEAFVDGFMYGEAENMHDSADDVDFIIV